jgi:large subunit ribosomal protein L54
VNPAAATKASQRPPSSCAAGTRINGLNYFKNKPEVFAKEDHEYPDWLWDLLGDASKEAKATKGGVDPASTWIPLLSILPINSNLNTNITPSQP